MQITVQQSERVFSALAHFAVFDPQSQKLFATSYVGRATSVSAVSASIINGYTVEMAIGQVRHRIRIPYGASCRRFERKVNDLYHGVVMVNQCGFYRDGEDKKPEKAGDAVVLAPDGDIPAAVGRYLCAKYHLPDEWSHQYFGMLPREKVDQLTVLVNPGFEKWKDLKAVQVQGITEEFILKLIDVRLKGGRLKIPAILDAPQGTYKEGMNMAEFMKANALILACKTEHLRPWFVPGEDNLHPAIAGEKRIPFPSQAYVIQALVNAYREIKTLYVNGEMSVGKSILSSVLARTLQQKSGRKGYNVLLCAPSLTLPKWEEKELAETLHGIKTRIIRSTEDAARLLRRVRAGYRPDKLEFTLISLDRAKLGPDPWCAAIWRKIHPVLVKGQQEKVMLSGEYAWHCPDCMQPLPHPDAKDDNETDDVYADWFVMAESECPRIEKGEPLTTTGLPQDYQVKWHRRSELKKCPHCETKLWRPALKKRGETRNRPRWFADRILKKISKRNHFNLGIFDEVHQAKAQGSGRGSAYGQLVKCCDKRLNLTGTLMNGKASSIQMIMWRTDPKALIDDGFTHKTGAVEFASRYGALERVEFIKEGDHGINTRQVVTQRQPVEIPGISPRLSVTHLFDRTAYIGLADLGLPLVKLDERPIFITPDEHHAKAYREFHERLYSAAKEAARKGSKSALAQFEPATVNYADHPNKGIRIDVVTRDQYGREHVTVVEAPALGKDYYNAKERALVEMVKKELAKGRGCIIYANYTAKYKADQRIQKVLAEHGIGSALLKADTPSDKRFEWLADRAREGCQVLISNVSLVEVGLDLLSWPTIINYQLTNNVNTLRQANRRNWRIGATLECQVFYLIMDGTQQVEVLKRVMKGRGHALLQEGKIDRSELAEYARDSHSALTFDIANCLASKDLADKWRKLAEKDFDEGLEMLSEPEFQQVIKERMAELAAETRRLCGLPEQPAQEPVEDTELLPTGEMALFDMPNDVSAGQGTTMEPISGAEPQLCPVRQPSLLDIWNAAGVEVNVTEQKPERSTRRRSRSKRRQATAQSTSLFSDEYLRGLVENQNQNTA